MASVRTAIRWICPKPACQQLRKLAADQGIEIYAVAANNDFSSPIPEHREAQLVYLRDLLRMTSDLGAKIVRVFLAWPGVTLLPQGGGRYDFARDVWKAEHAGFSEEQTWAWCRESMVEACKLAGDAGVTLALQNHPPVISGYADTIRMAREVASPHLKLCFDARLEHSLDEPAIRKAVNEVGALQTLWHFGGEYDRGPDGITVKGDEKALAEALGLLDIGYKGYAGFELCHPLPVVDGRTVGLDFVDKNAQLAAEYLRGIIAEARKRQGVLGLQFGVASLGVESYCATLSKNFSDFAAQVSQRNSRARNRPRSTISARRSGESSSRPSASRNSTWLRGSTRAAASPAISGREETFEVTTGTPAAIACATGNPNPS